MTRRGEETMRALAGGVVATGLLSGALLAARALGVVRLNFGRILGTLVAPDGGEAWAMGWGMNFVNGALLALGYQFVFRRLGMWPGALSGALVGLVHALAALGFVATAPAVHPRPRQAGLKQMGPFAYGALTIPGMVLGHLLYGAIVGSFIGNEPRQTYAVGAAFLRWLTRQEAEERAGLEPALVRSWRRPDPGRQRQPNEPPVWAVPARAA